MQNPFTDGISVQIGADASPLTSEIDNALGAIGGLETAVVGVGAALAGLAAGGLAKATQASVEFEKQLADLEKVTSAQMLGPLKQGIMDLSEEIPMARSGLVELATQAGKFGAESEEEIMAFVESVGQIASATDLAADEAGTRFAKIAGAIGMPMEDIGKLGNAVNSLADSMKTDATEITDTATRASNVLSQQLGLGADAVVSLSASMNEVSSSSRLAGSSLRRMAETMMDPKKVADMAGALGMTTDEFKAMRESNPQGLMNMIAEAMNENGEAATLLRGSIGKAANDFSKLGGQLDATADAQELTNEQFENGTSLQREMSIRTDTFSGQMQLLRNRLQNVASTIGDRLLPYFKEAIGVLIQGVEWFSSLNSETDGLAGVLSLVTGVIVGTTAAAAGLAAQVGIASSTTAALTGALGALLGPLGLVIAAVAAFGAAFATNFGGVRDHTMRVVTALQDALQPAIEWFQSDGVSIVDQIRNAVVTFVTVAEPYVAQFASVLGNVLVGAIEKTAEAFTAAFNLIQSVVTTVWESVLRPFINWMGEAWQAHGDTIMAVVEPLWNGIKTIITNAIAIIQETVDLGLSVLKGDWQAAGESLRIIVQTMWNSLKTIFTTGFETLKTVVMMGWNAITEWIGSIGRDDIYNAFKAIGSAIRTILLGLFAAGGWIWKTVTGLIGSLVEWIRNDAKSDIKAAFGAVMTTIKNQFIALMGAGGELWGIIKTFVGDFATYIGSGQAWSDITAAFGSLIDGIFAIFEGLYDGLIGNSLIPDMIGDIVSYLSGEALSDFKDAIGNLVDGGLNKVEGIASDFKDAGKALGSTLADGIKSKAGEVEDAASGLAEGAREFFNGSDAERGPLSDTTDAGAAIPETIAKGALSNMGELQNALGQMALPNHAAPGTGTGVGGGGGKTVNIKVDARGSENPSQTRRSAERGLSSALDAYNV